MVFRALVFTHRYLGIALGVLMLMWSLSGIVMMYVSYPELDTAARRRSLQSLDRTQCCRLDALAELDGAMPIGGFEIEMQNGEPLLRLAPDFGPEWRVRLANGQAMEEVDERAAVQTAQQFMRTRGVDASPVATELIERDQWTVYPRYNDQRPLYRFRFDDENGTLVYVSSVTGQVAQVTTRSERFWNWLGAVPHWLYFTALRQNAALWNQVVIWSALAGCFLTAFGLWLGVLQLRRKADGRVASPYRGLKWWHHVPGLLFGVLVLTWVLSGLLSMTPWGLLETQDEAADARRLQGEPPTWETVRAMLQTLPQAPLPRDTVSIESAFLGDRVYAVVATRGGLRQRFDAAWNPAALSDAENAASLHRLAAQGQAASWTLLAAEDSYYYSHGAAQAVLPVVRLSLEGAQPIHYYVDAVSGALLKKVDGPARGYRWLHYGLHRMDFPLLRARPLWDVLMWLLLAGVSMVCATGAYMGLKRLARR